MLYYTMWNRPSVDRRQAVELRYIVRTVLPWRHIHVVLGSYHEQTNRVPRSLLRLKFQSDRDPLLSTNVTVTDLDPCS